MEVLKDEDLSGIKRKRKALKHKKSGARVLLVENDNNKVFSIALRNRQTVAQEFRILWSIPYLAGQRYPFLVKIFCILNTTYPDKTVYPVASCNDKRDFQNLMHVYMDAVLHPNIYNHDKTFRQEGWPQAG